jgi:hypothetical protein
MRRRLYTTRERALKYAYFHGRHYVRLRVTGISDALLGDEARRRLDELPSTTIHYEGWFV